MDDSDALADRFRDPVVLGVLAVTALALLARFLLLGHRVAHWDEGRVAYWILDYMRTGTYYYRPIIHGPFYHHVNDVVFSLFGPSDYTMRIPAAIVGGLLPLSALLLRQRLRNVEVVALSLLLAATPVLLYFSWFMRGDIIVGGFMFVGFALAVRAIDTRQAWYLPVVAASVALGFAAKENAIAYLLAWAGAAVLLFDHRLLRARDGEDSWAEVAATQFRRTWAAVRHSATELAVSLVVFLAVVVWFYAPRGEVPSNGDFYRYCGGSGIVDMGGVVGFGRILANPGAIPDVVAVATIGSAEVVGCQWVGGAVEDGNAYIPYFADLVGTVAAGAGALAVLAVVGFVADRYGGDRPRDVTMFTFYWGVASLVGYPLITDIQAPWAAVHVVLPLAVPAAAGAALIYREGTAALAADDRVNVALAFGLLVLVSGQVAGAAIHTSYLAPQSPDNELVQYAQPSGEMQGTLADVQRLSAGNEGTDVLLYGDYFVDGDQQAVRKPACADWFGSLPLPWYWATDDTNVSCATSLEEFNRTVERERPPVVITPASEKQRVEDRLDGYEARHYLLRSFDTETVFFVREQ